MWARKYIPRRGFSAPTKYSSVITEPKIRAPSRSFLYAIGLTEEDFKKPFVGISPCWVEGNPCNVSLLSLSEVIKESVTEAGLNGLRFSTISASDAISIGTEGMRFSLLSRELIADSVEAVSRNLYYDANITIPNCDKNMPGVLIAHARLNRPGLIVYGGATMTGSLKGEEVDIQRVNEIHGELLAGKITEKQFDDITRCAVPCSGSCPGMFTASTMSIAIEALGMCLPGSSSTPNVHPNKQIEARQAGPAIRNLLEKNIRTGHRDNQRWQHIGDIQHHPAG